MRRGVKWDLVLTNEGGLVSNMKLKGNVGCSDHEMMEFKILRVSKRACSKLASGEQTWNSAENCLAK